MSGTFTIKIELGNAEMSCNADVAKALREIAKRLDRGVGEGWVRDANGNTVGNFELTKDKK